MQIPSDILRAIRRRWNQLQSERDRRKTRWMDIQKFILPEHGIGLSGTDEKDIVEGAVTSRTHILDSEASQAMTVLAAGMQSGLTSPARPWFRLGLADALLTQEQSVKVWLADVEDALRYFFARSNIYNALHHCYLELGAFGTACMYVEEDYDIGLRARPMTVGEYWVALDGKLRVRSLYRRLWLTAAQLVELFGAENCSDAVTRAFNDSRTEQRFPILHVIEPNDTRLKIERVDEKYPYRSVYAEESETDAALFVGGYHEFPAMAPRWNVVGARPYGDGCGTTILGDVKMLQKLREKQLVNLDKVLSPPMQAPASMRNDVVTFVPGGVNFLPPGDVGKGMQALYNVPAALGEAEAVAQNVKASIKAGCYVDMFLMLAQIDNRMTAREVAERHEEKLLMLGPVLERLHDELLNPLIDRAFGILMRAGAFPPPPPEIQGQQIKVEYISILAQAQKMVGLSGLTGFVGFVQGLAQTSPDAMDNLDLDAAAREAADSYGVNPKLVRDPKALAVIRKGRQDAQAQERQIALAGQAAKATKDLSGSYINGQNALSSIASGPGGLVAGGGQ